MSGEPARPPKGRRESIVEIVSVRYLPPSGSSRHSAARLAGEALMALNERRGGMALRLDLTTMVDPGHAWVDELLNLRLVPHCRARGIPITVVVGTPFAQHQLLNGMDLHARHLVDVHLVARESAAQARSKTE